ncbi:MAG: type II toxin-antitoxin system VapC family toxin [bacterium]
MTTSVADTSIWIGFLRDGTAEGFVRRGLHARRLLLASVVAHELYLGVTDRVEKRELDRICAAFSVENLRVTPSFEDWSTAGVLLQRYGRLHGAIEARTLLNDVLIVLCAAAHRAVLVTWNVRDMDRWNKMLPRHRRVRVATPRHADRVQ